MTKKKPTLQLQHSLDISDFFVLTKPVTFSPVYKRTLTKNFKRRVLKGRQMTLIYVLEYLG